MIEELKKEGLFLPTGAFNPSYVKKFNNTLTPERKEWFDSCIGDSLSEKVYCITHSITSKPTCKHCGNPVKFVSFGEGYREYCSLSCRAFGTTKSRQETNIKKYGVAHPAQNPDVQRKMKETTLERHGVDNVFRDNQKIKEAFKEKYGETHPMYVKEFKEKQKSFFSSPENSDRIKSIISKRNETNIKKYGNICSIQSPEIQKKIRLKIKQKRIHELFNSNKYSSIATPLFTFEDYIGTTHEDTTPVYYKWKCCSCNMHFEDHIANGTLPRCPSCYPPEIRGVMEKDFVNWLLSELPSDTPIILNDRRKLCPPLEIDIYLPSYNLAIEFDEVYWHCESSSKGKRDVGYHIGKTNACKEKGVSLLHIFDNEWIDRKDIVKSIIRSKLGIYSTKIGARKCQVKEISVEESRAFLDENHIQGYAPSSYRYGLFYNGKLVSHLAIAKNRFKEGTYEIVRYASLLNHSVQGGLSKLWNEVRKHLPTSFTLVSYVDLRFFDGESNTAIGLIYSHTNRPAYHYTKDYKTLENRMNYQKKNIKNNPSMLYNDELTEWENMQQNKYDRIWDCGTKVYFLNT